MNYKAQCNFTRFLSLSHKGELRVAIKKKKKGKNNNEDYGTGKFDCISLRTNKTGCLS